jgi:hypothetical protein
MGAAIRQQSFPMRARELDEIIDEAGTSLQ